MFDDLDDHDWQSVPVRVARLFPKAAAVAVALRKTSALPRRISWDPASNVAASQQTDDIPGVSAVVLASPDEFDGIKIAAGNPVVWLQDAVGKLFNGPTPMSNAIVGGLVGAGAGYVGGRALGKVLPKSYFDGERLATTLAALGAGAGAVPGLWQGINQAGLTSPTTGKPLGWSGFVTPTEQVPIQRAGASGKTAAEIKPVPVDAFNRAIWNDVSLGMTAARNPFGTKDPWSSNQQNLHTPAPVAGAVSGLMSGISQMYGGADLLSPRHIVNGLVSAGVGGLAARTAGTVLGVLGGLTPDAQKKLQQVGIWGGLIRGVAGSIFGQ